MHTSNSNKSRIIICVIVLKYYPSIFNQFVICGIRGMYKCSATKLMDCKTTKSRYAKCFSSKCIGLRIVRSQMSRLNKTDFYFFTFKTKKYI